MAGIPTFTDSLAAVDALAHGHRHGALTEMGKQAELVFSVLNQDMVPPNVAAPHVYGSGTGRAVVPLSIPNAHHCAVGRREDGPPEGPEADELTMAGFPGARGNVGRLYEIVRVTLIRHVPGM